MDAFLRQDGVEELVAAHGAVLDAVRQRDAEAVAASMRARLAESCPTSSPLCIRDRIRRESLYAA